MKRFRGVIVGSAICLLGCPGGSKVPGFDAGTLAAIDAGAIVDASLGDAGQPRRALRYEVAGALVDGGVTFIAISDSTMPIDSDALRGLTITSVALRDYRIRVIDSADQVVPSDDTAIELDGGLTYSIAFAQPLKAGKTYALTFEAQNGPQLTDLSGKAWDDVRVTLKIRGEPAVEPGGKPAPKRKKH